MEATMATPRRFARTPLAALGKVTVGSFIGLAALFGYAQILFGFVPIITGLALVALLLAGLVASGWRWTPLLGTLIFGALLALVLLTPISNEVFYILSRSSEAGLFSLVLALLPVLAVGTVAGLTATVQNYRRPVEARRTPRGLYPMLLLLAGLVAGAILLAYAPQTRDDGGISPEVLATLPAVTPEDFMPGKEIKVKAGELVAFRLENADPVGHTFDIDELNVHAPMAAGKQGVALFKADKPGTYTFYCVPHFDKASGEGMKGTLIVE